MTLFRKRAKGQYDARAVANWFIRKSALDEDQGHKTQLQLLKLVYFSHAWMLGIYGRPLLAQDIHAWKYGPVVPELYHAIKHWNSQPVVDQIPGFEDFNDFDEQAEDILEQVYDVYGSLSGYELSDITHRPESPWFVTRMQRFPGAVIPNKLIQDFFSQDKVDA